MTEEAQTEEDPSIEEILDSIRQIISEDEEEGDSAPAPQEAAPVVKKKPEAKPDPEPESVSEEPLDQSAIDDMDFDAPDVEAKTDPEPAPVSEEPLDQSAIDDMDFDAPAAEEKPEPEQKNEEPLDQSAVDDMDFDAPAAETKPDEQEEEPEPEDDSDDILELTDRVDDIVEEKPESPQPDPDPVPAPQPEPAPVSVDGSDTILTKVAEDAAFDAISELARKTAVEHNGITLEDIVRREIKPLLRIWLDKNLPVVIERLVREELERVSKRVLDE